MAAAVCRVCRLHAAEYTCPRCNARYCSLNCYRRHSDQCTEGFYREAAVSELRSISAGEDEKRGMLEILQRLHQQELGDGGSEGDGSEGEEGGGLSAETMHRLLAKMQAAGGTLEVGTEDLSPAELAAFHRALAAGELAEAVQPWQPWWLGEEAARLELSAGGTRLMAAVEQGGASEQQQAATDGGTRPAAAAAAAGEGSGALPAPPPRALPPLAALTRAAPSPLLRYQLLDVLYAYCHTLRLYNGDCSCEAEAAADALFALSAVLAAVAGPADSAASSSGGEGSSAGVAPALLGCLQRACSPPLGSREGKAFAVGVVSDVAALLQLGRPVVLTALMDASRLLEAARQQLEGGGDGGGAKQQRKEARRRLVAAERKLLFFLAWANEQPPEAYELLAMAVAAEHGQHAAAVAAASVGGPTAATAGAQLGSRNGGSPAAVLIEEL